MILTKKQAREKNLKYSKLCKFHDKYPDQVASESSCQKCMLIREPCGCDDDMYCEACNPEAYEDEKVAE